jgi:hypothetical protein
MSLPTVSFRGCSQVDTVALPVCGARRGGLQSRTKPTGVWTSVGQSIGPLGREYYRGKRYPSESPENPRSVAGQVIGR